MYVFNKNRQHIYLYMYVKICIQIILYIYTLYNFVYSEPFLHTHNIICPNESLRQLSTGDTSGTESYTSPWSSFPCSLLLNGWGLSSLDRVPGLYTQAAFLIGPSWAPVGPNVPSSFSGTMEIIPSLDRKDRMTSRVLLFSWP